MALSETKTLSPSAKHPENAVARVLRDQIQSGNFKPGEWLPTERKLAEDLNVDRRTVRMAINQLVRGGLVIRRPHCRPIVGSVAEGRSETTTPNARGGASTSNFIALLMWNGSGQLERAVTSQQRIFWGMSQALADAGYHAVFVGLGNLGTEEEDAAREAEQLRYVLKQEFGGAIFYPYAYRRNQALVEDVRQVVPLITIDRRVESVNTDLVSVDNHRGTYDMTMHLVRQGHTRIAYMTKNELVFAVQARIQGYIDAMRDVHLPETVLSMPTRSLEQEWMSVDAVFRLPYEERPTAVAVFNDHAAVDLMVRLEGMGLSVPGDVAIAGFDDIVSLLPNGVGLTTVAQPYEEIGRRAVEVLLRRLKDPVSPTVSVYLPAELTIRESSAYPRADQGKDV